VVAEHGEDSDELRNFGELDPIKSQTEEMDAMFANYQRVPLWDGYSDLSSSWESDRPGRSGRHIMLWVRDDELGIGGKCLRGEGKENVKVALMKWNETKGILRPDWRERQIAESHMMEDDYEEK
jgi:hypothetical protein